MKFLEVSDKDMKHFAQLINMIHVGQFSVNGKDVCASADTIRWLQDQAKGAAECYSKSVTSKPSAPMAEVEKPKPPMEAPPSAGLPAGVTVKGFNPGKSGKSK